MSPGVPIYRDAPTFYANDIDDIASRFNLNVFCAYYVLSNGPNWEDFSIISFFGVIFGQNLGICPAGIHLYKAASNCYTINIEDIASRFNLNIFCAYYVLSNGPNWEDFRIYINFGVILVIIRVFNPRGAHL